MKSSVKNIDEKSLTIICNSNHFKELNEQSITLFNNICFLKIHKDIIKFLKSNDLDTIFLQFCDKSIQDSYGYILYQ